MLINHYGTKMVKYGKVSHGFQTTNLKVKAKHFKMRKSRELLI